MARLARAVAPGMPHHVTQRGNRRQTVFFNDDDYAAYLDLLRGCAGRAGLSVWAYCLMPNHVHLIAVPEKPDSLRAAIAETHRRYARRVNRREDWRGHLWQERFASFAMDEVHCLVAARYVELNPVRAGLVETPGAYRWSSAGTHLDGESDDLMKNDPLPERVGDWAEFLKAWPSEEDVEAIRRHGRTGRPLGDGEFVARMEAVLGRRLQRAKRGRKPAVAPEGAGK